MLAVQLWLAVRRQKEAGPEQHFYRPLSFTSFPRTASMLLLSAVGACLVARPGRSKLDVAFLGGLAVTAVDAFVAFKASKDWLRKWTRDDYILQLSCTLAATLLLLDLWLMM
jgi:hypothetical protein